MAEPTSPRAGDGTAMPLDALLEPVTCPICETAEYRVLQRARYPQQLSPEDLLRIYRSSSDRKLMDQLVACAGCGLVYLNPRLSSATIIESYRSGADPVHAQQDPMRIRTFRRALDKIVRRYGLVADPSSRVLDVGCAGGAFPRAAAELGFSVVGVEPNEWLCEHGRRRYGLDLRAGLLEDQCFESRSFDLVTLWDVLEHVASPAAELSEIHRVAKDGAYLIVSYPDYASLACRLLGPRWPFLLSVHLFYFTPRTMRALLRKCGFDVLALRPHWQTLELGYVLSRAGPYVPGTARVQRLTELLGCSRLPLTYNMGQSLVVARKRRSR